MPSAFYPTPSERRRAAVFVLIVAVHVLVAWLVLTNKLSVPKLSEPKVFNLIPIPAPTPTPEPTPKPTPKARRKVAAASRTPAARPPAAVKPTVKPAPKLFGTELFEAVDIAKLPNHSKDKPAPDAIADSGAGKDSSSVYGPSLGGGGGGGEPLYNAEWQREPTHAELAGYLPNGAPPGSWGMIACRTVEKFRVEDCRELDESTPGGGLARALRQAAWQFRVRPPRVGGHTLVGAWVRIRFDFTESGAKEGG